ASCNSVRYGCVVIKVFLPPYEEKEEGKEYHQYSGSKEKVFVNESEDDKVLVQFCCLCVVFRCMPFVAMLMRKLDAEIHKDVFRSFVHQLLNPIICLLGC